ncbi:hypothetical protein [Bradyrhizobium sp. 143]|uniref:hypothetical protein n=1 Tax=Bradyrhizobium sp. 143 TaxID=2782619 RepID=UPI001FFA3E7B|nr:hypothetical protein [Bradyrhizobium sp. 143]MCK1707714.1 hypothetical protein [Bradyrhizobium sp. 143]MCK1730015.1 hypothetical protein [Bradyrhizobium sp. 142]
MGKLRVYLDTIYERATNDFFERVTLPVLMSSRYLIVVATPDAAPREQATNDWMRREIEAFEAGPNRGNIILVRAAGAFAGPLPGDLAVRYPNIEIIDMRGYGPFAFLNPAKASRLADETVKIVAPLLGLTSEDMPAIRREEERRQQFRLGLAAGSAIAVIGAVTAVFAFLSRNNALDALSRSVFATERTIQTIRSLQPGEARNNLLASSCDLLDSLADRAPSPPQALALVACRAERADAHDRLKEPDRAAEMLAAATKIAEEGFARTGAADDALAVVEARRATLERAIRTDIQNAGRVASDFATRALEFAKKMKEEHEIPETAARALQKSAVEFLQAKQDDAALDTVNASIEAGSIALSRQERLSMQLEHVVTVALKSQVLFEREEKGAADEVRAKAKAMLDQIDGKKADAEGLARRYSEAADLVAKTGKGYLDR